MVKCKITKPHGEVIEVEASADDFVKIAFTLGLGMSFSWTQPSPFMPSPLAGGVVIGGKPGRDF